MCRAVWAGGEARRSGLGSGRSRKLREIWGVKDGGGEYGGGISFSEWVGEFMVRESHERF